MRDYEKLLCRVVEDPAIRLSDLGKSLRRGNR